MPIPKDKVKTPYSSLCPLPEFVLWQKRERKAPLFSFELELTARCNNNCRHCYINLPAQSKIAKNDELTTAQIKNLIDQAASLGALWAHVTGGEPLLREDFFDIYMYLKKKGIMISVFTNATLITREHIKVFKKHPPRDIEVTVYGTTRETYERVTRRKGSFRAFMRGLALLSENRIGVRLKAMALRSNFGELQEIFRFCRKMTKDNFRFDPFLHLRLDRDPERNEEIKSERLPASEIVALERGDPERFQALGKGCDKLVHHRSSHAACDHIFSCGAGKSACTIGFDGSFRPCSALQHPDCTYDLKKGTLQDAWEKVIPRVRNMRSKNEEFLKKCHGCPWVNLCMWCPAYAYLENGKMDAWIESFCDLAHARKNALTLT